MTPELRLGEDLALPLEAVTETFAILAKRRAGKSNAAVVLAEEMFAAGLPWVAVDPKGDWWGIRASGDGPGLAVVVFGGAAWRCRAGAGGRPADRGPGRAAAVDVRVGRQRDVAGRSAPVLGGLR